MSSTGSTKKALLAIGSCAVILVCGIHLSGLLLRNQPAPFLPAGIQDQVGRALAQAAAADLEGSGTVALLTYDDGNSPMAFKEDQLQATVKALKANGIEVRDTVRLEANQLVPELGVMEADVYLAAMESFQDVDAIVSLAGLPAPDPTTGQEALAALRQLPPLYCVTQDRETLQLMMKSGLVKAAVCEKGEPSEGLQDMTVEAVFSNRFEVVASTPSPAGE